MRNSVKILILLTSAVACASMEPIIVKQVKSANVYSDGGSISIDGILENNLEINILLDLSLTSQIDNVNAYNTIRVDGKKIGADDKMRILFALHNWLTANTKYNTWNEITRTYLNEGMSNEHLGKVFMVGALIEQLCIKDSSVSSKQLCDFYQKK